MIKQAMVVLCAAMIVLTVGCGGGSSGGNPPPRGLPENPASDFDYKYDAAAGGVVITKYTGTSMRVRIPEKIENAPVTAISDRAFEKSGIMEVYIPNSVTSIGERAFADSTGVTSVTIPNSVTSIGIRAFFGTGLTSVAIPDSVTSISRGVGLLNNGAFDGIPNLTVTYKGRTYTATGLNQGNAVMPRELYR